MSNNYPPNNPSVPKETVTDSSHMWATTSDLAGQKLMPTKANETSVSSTHPTYAEQIMEGSHKYSAQNLPKLTDKQLLELSEADRDEYLKAEYEKDFLGTLTGVQQKSHLARMKSADPSIRDFYYQYHHDQNAMAIKLKNKKALHSELELFKIIKNHINTRKQETPKKI